MRAADWHHVLVVTEVGVNEQGEASYFQYAQSSCMYGAESGVRSGYAIIKDRHAPLVSQQWFDGHPGKVIERLLQEGGESSRVVRLKALV
jgi:hypothetical protein